MSDSPKNLTVNASDLLGALAICAQRIVGAAMNHANGAPFPDPRAIANELKRMGELNDALITIQSVPANDQAA